MSNFWINKEGVNTLKGTHTNPLNKIYLPDHLIAEFLVQHPHSRKDFLTLFETMLPEEQFRLQEILDSYPGLFKDREHDQEIEDNFQSRANKSRVNTVSKIKPKQEKVKKTLRVNR